MSVCSILPLLIALFPHPSTMARVRLMIALNALRAKAVFSKVRVYGPLAFGIRGSFAGLGAIACRVATVILQEQCTVSGFWSPNFSKIKSRADFQASRQKHVKKTYPPFPCVAFRLCFIGARRRPGERRSTVEHQAPDAYNVIVLLNPATSGPPSLLLSLPSSRAPSAAKF